EDGLGVVEAAVEQDVRLDALEEPEGRSFGRVARVERVDRRLLGADLLDGQPARVPGAPRVVADAEVRPALPARALRHLLEGRLAVRPGGVAMERPAQVVQLDESGDATGGGRL